MAIGIITGRRIGKNRDGTADRVILQVELLQDIEEPDVRTVELITQSGEDNNPANGCRVYIAEVDNSYEVGIAVTDDLTPDVDPGEKEFYSTDITKTLKKARIKFGADGNITMNLGINHATQQEALQTAINAFLVALNAQLVGLGGAGGLTCDLTLAKILTVLVP